jgi:predicted cupin superfamily sugar epimerase
MHPRASELIRRLELEPHPEGGLFRRTSQSGLVVQPGDSRGPRHALTAIYFLLVDHGISRWHRVTSDEAWHWYEGSPLELLTAPADGGVIVSRELGPISDSAAPQCVVPANCWQAARCKGAYSLVGCCVGPGFEFADFTLLASLPDGEQPRLTPAALAAEFR